MKKYTISYHDGLSLRDVLSIMEIRHVNYLALLDPKGCLMGSISEADIRKAILTNKTMVKDFFNPYPVKAVQGADLKQMQLILKQNYSSHLPIVDSNMKLMEVKRIEHGQVLKKKNPVVLMVGGLGKRLGELTRELPKPMLPLGHKPILQLIIESFVGYGFRDFYFCVNYKSESIREYFGDGESFGVNITYIEESKPLGTAGALGLIDENWNEPFIVMNGDLITTLNFESLLHFHLERGGMATMCIHEYNYQLPFGVVNTRNAKILSLEEKPRQKCYVNAGIYVLDPKVFAYLPHNEYLDMTTLFERMIQEDQAVFSYYINEFWMDIGQVKDYEATREIFSLYNL
ncbi:MAG: NTP transferase domain-containing protein [Bacteroidia bacterium]|nr:NTP transferase domain-containing protein [Bacteroidia bacterium]